jgi:hypothetical protein
MSFQFIFFIIQIIFSLPLAILSFAIIIVKLATGMILFLQDFLPVLHYSDVILYETRAISNHMCRLMMANFMLGHILWQTDRQCTTRLGTDHFGWNCTSSLWGVVRTSFCVSGNTQKKKHFYQRTITRPKIIQPENPCNMRKDLSYRSIL